jgi:hypothetical protein
MAMSWKIGSTGGDEIVCVPCFAAISLHISTHLVPAARVFISPKISSAIFPKSSVDVVGTAIPPERSGYTDS